MTRDKGYRKCSRLCNTALSQMPYTRYSNCLLLTEGRTDRVTLMLVHSTFQIGWTIAGNFRFIIYAFNKYL